VLEEWRGNRGAWARVFDAQAPVLFAGSRYAKRLPIGLPEVLKTAHRDALLRFYRDWYRPDLMAVIVVGDVEPAAVEKEIARRFGELAAPASPRKRPRGEVPAASGLRVSIVTDAELGDAVVSIEDLIPHRAEATARDYRRGLVEGLYELILADRLDVTLERPESPMLWASASTGDLTREIDEYRVDAGAKAGRVLDTVEAALSEVVRIEQHGVGQGELDRARTRWLRSLDQAAREIDKHDAAELAAEMTRNFFEDELMPGRVAEAALAAKLMPGITVEEVEAVAREVAGDDDRVILIAAPDGAKVPTEGEVRDVAKKVAGARLEPWRDEDVGGVLITEAPAGGTVKDERTLDAYGVTEWTLSNGVRVVVKPTDFENDRVIVDGFSPGGTAQASDAIFPSARFASEIVAASGAGEHSDRSLDRLLAGAVVNVVPWIGEVSEGVQASGSVRDLETLLQLVYLTIAEPRRDEQAFAVWKQSALEWVKNRRADPETVFWDEMVSKVSKDHARRRPPQVSDIEKVELDRALAFYQARFGDASDFTFVIVGDVDPKVLRPLVERYLGGLPAAGRVETEKDIGVRPPKGKVVNKVERGKEPKAYVYLSFRAEEKWTRDAARDLDVLADVLNIRLREVLREQLGGVYGVDVDAGLTRRPRQERTFTIQFGCAPENVESLQEAVFDEIARLQKSGAGDDVLEKVRKARVRGREVALRSNEAWAGWLTYAWRYGDDLAVLLDLEADLARISSAHVKAAAKKYLDRKAYVLGILTPKS
jgi:zinc protease